MKIKLKVNENKTVSPSDIVIGSMGERNIDSLVIEHPNIAGVKWYLYISNTKMILPFTNDTLVIDHNLTSGDTTKSVVVIGSDAKKGESVTTGKHCFISDKFIMRVKEW